MSLIRLDVVVAIILMMVLAQIPSFVGADDNDGGGVKPARGGPEVVTLINREMTASKVVDIASIVVGADVASWGKAPHVDPDPLNMSAAALETPGQRGGFYGVPLTPAVYFVNFLLLYMANPNEAANMPAYRAPIPMALSDCLGSNPEGCSYSSYALSFDDDAKGNKSCVWPTECQTDPKWERLAPGIATRPDQINEPLGIDRANRLAGLLGMDKSMILTDQEYECTIGIPPRDDDRKTIFACINNLTNSNGNTNIPLSSYGLAITDDRNADVPAGDVQSLCAPKAPCLIFNDLFAGPLERIAAVCGWEKKLERMVTETPFFEFVEDGGNCQAFGGSKDGGPCIVEPVCPSERDD